MTELRYYLPASNGSESAGRMETESDPAISIDEESGIGYPNTVRSTRRRYLAMPTSQAASDPEGVATRISSHDLHCHPRYSQPQAWPWGKVHNSMRAAWHRLKQCLRHGIQSQDN